MIRMFYTFLNITDYLLKPFSFERFLKAINKTTCLTNGIQEQYSSKSSNRSDKSVFLRNNKKYTQVNISTIQYIKAAGNYTKIVANNDDTITVRGKISDILQLLSENDFLRVHKSFAVGIKYIKSIQGSRIFMKDHIIPIGKMYKLNIYKLLS